MGKAKDELMRRGYYDEFFARKVRTYQKINRPEYAEDVEERLCDILLEKLAASKRDRLSRDKLPTFIKDVPGTVIMIFNPQQLDDIEKSIGLGYDDDDSK